MPPAENSSNSLDDVIMPPKGRARTLIGKGSLQQQMGLDLPEFSKFKNVVKQLAAKHLNPDDSFAALQSKQVAMQEFIEKCRNAYKPLERYPEGWPVEAFLFQNRSRRGHYKNRIQRQQQTLGKSNEDSLAADTNERDTRKRPRTEARGVSRLRTIPTIASASPPIPFHYESFLVQSEPSLLAAFTVVGVTSLQLFRILVKIPAHDNWLHALERKRVITFTQRAQLADVIARYADKQLGSPIPRVTDRFSPRGGCAHDTPVAEYFLSSLYPPLTHLRQCFDNLGIVTFGNLIRVACMKDRDHEFLCQAVDEKMMTPLEAKIVCDALLVISVSCGSM